MRNVKLFTHTDLDGAGCAIIAKLAFENENLEIEYCDYGDIDKKVLSFYSQANAVDYDVYITDISINEDVAKVINNSTIYVELYDHHSTALWLNKYEWATVIPKDDYSENLESGTSLLNNYLEYNFDYSLKNINKNINELVEMVRMYDTWEWKNKYNDIRPKQLNDLFYLYGRDKFIDEYVKRITSGEFVPFTEHDKEILEAEENKINRYIDKKSKQLIETEILGYKAGVVFAEQYVSEMGNKLSDQNPHLDFIAMIDMGYKTVSYRTVKKDMDLGKDVAKIFGGGGHPMAAGSKFEDFVINELIKNVFDGGNQ